MVWDNPANVILIIVGVVVAIGGIVTLVRQAGQDSSPRGAYLPLGMVVVGIVIAYHTFADYRTIDSQDIVIMFLFALGLLSLMGLQYFIVDRNRHHFQDQDRALDEKPEESTLTGSEKK